MYIEEAKCVLVRQMKWYNFIDKLAGTVHMQGGCNLSHESDVPKEQASCTRWHRTKQHEDQFTNHIFQPRSWQEQALQAMICLLTPWL